MRIIYKILLSFYLIILIIGIISYIAIHNSHQTMRNEIGKTVESLTGLVAKEMDTRINERIDHFHEFIISSYLQDFLSQSNMDFEKMVNMQGYIDEKDNEWTAAPKGEITPFMRKLIENDLSEIIRSKIGFYNDMFNFKVYGEVFVTNKFGANVAQTGKTSDFRQDDEEWWQSARRDGFYIRDVAYDESSGVYSTDVAIRIDDNKGSFIGVIKIVLNIEDTFEYLRQYVVSGRYKDVNITLTTKQGKVIYPSSGGQFFKDVSKDEFFTSAKGETGFFMLPAGKSEQDAKFFAYARSKRFGWLLFTEYKSDELFAPLNRLNNRLSILAVGMVLLTLVIGYLIAKTISRPIEHLKNIAHAIGDGKLETTIDVYTRDEVGELASVLAWMTNELKQRATVDHLTQAFNRLKLDEIMPMEIARARRYQRALSVSVLDIDYFKKVNDIYGHIAGDYVLKAIADIVKTNLRKTNYLFRSGGEEFLIVAPEADLNGACIMAERIRKAIEDYRFKAVGTVTVSFGVAQLKDDDTIDSLIERADTAMYQAKANGRNRVAS